MNVLPILPLLAIALLIAVVPAWPYSRNWGNFPSSVAGIVLLVLVIMWLRGQI
jgi:hypothetical protein